MSREKLHSLPPCVLHEDEHLLVVNKPAGWNTHAPSPYAGEGIYDWLKHREPRWVSLAIFHRLDKETSGVLVFGKTPLANRSLTDQFTARTVRKKYYLLTDHAPKQREFTVKSRIVRGGDRYVSGPHGEWAETRFGVPPSGGSATEKLRQFKPDHLKTELQTVEAEPLTGRTHQIRVHAAENGFPVLGDTLYGGSPWARVCLHAAELSFQHPVTGEVVTFSAHADFTTDARLALRRAFIESDVTDAFRLIHGASDGWPGWYVERLGEFLLSQSERELTAAQRQHLATLLVAKAAYHKPLSRQVRQTTIAEASPKLIQGDVVPERFIVHENGVKFELSFNEGYSVGLFLDQRDNRRRLLTGHVAANFALSPEGRVTRIPNQKGSGTGLTRPSELRLEILNCFAYTCGFSVCAALNGARTTSLDLSKNYLKCGKLNFALNGLDPTQHDFIFGDVFDWLKRLGKKQRAFDVVLLDPPTFSQSKEGGVFRAEKDYGRLVTAALEVLKPGGVLFASTNAADWPPVDFLAEVERAIQTGRRKIVQQHYVPQPADFPVSRAEPAYLKTVWMRVA